MAKKNLLLVDADPKTLRMLEVSLRKAGFSVTTALGAEDAREKVQLSHPDVILTETKLPGTESGLEFVRRLKEEPHSRDIPVIFLSSEVSLEQKVKGLELGVEDYLTKPIYLKEVLTRVRVLLEKLEKAKLEKRERSATFNGVLGEMGLVDLVQTIEIGRKTGQLIVDSRGARGTIAFRDGKVVDARTGRLRGERAFYRMLVWNEGVFSMEFGAHDEADVIDLSTQGLLMEGMRRVDEWGRLLEQLPPLDRAFEIDFGELVDRLAEIPDEINGIIRLFDGQRTLLEVVDASDFGDLEALEIASKLYFEGLIYDVAAREPEDPISEPAQVARIEAWLDEEPEEGSVLPSEPAEDGARPKRVKTDVYGTVDVEPPEGIDDDSDALSDGQPSPAHDSIAPFDEASDDVSAFEDDLGADAFDEPPAPPALEDNTLEVDAALAPPALLGGSDGEVEETSPYGSRVPPMDEDVPAPPPAAFSLAPPSGVDDEEGASPTAEGTEDAPPAFGETMAPASAADETREPTLTPADGISALPSQEEVVAGFLDADEEDEDEWDDVVAPVGFTESESGIDDAQADSAALADDELAQELGLSQDEVALAVAGDTRAARRSTSVSAIPISSDSDDTLTPLPTYQSNSGESDSERDAEANESAANESESDGNGDVGDAPPLGSEFESPANKGPAPEADDLELVTADFELPGEEIHELTERKESGIHTLGPVIDDPVHEEQALEEDLNVSFDALESDDQDVDASEIDADDLALDESDDDVAATIPVQPAAAVEAGEGEATEAAEELRELDLNPSEIDFSGVDEDVAVADEDHADEEMGAAPTDIDSAAPTVIERTKSDPLIAKDIADYVAESDALLAESARKERESGALSAQSVDEIEDPALTPTKGIADDFFGRLDDTGGQAEEDSQQSAAPANDDVHEQTTPVPGPDAANASEETEKIAPVQTLKRDAPDDDLRELDDDWVPPPSNGGLKAAAVVALILLLAGGGYFITKELKKKDGGGQQAVVVDAGAKIAPKPAPAAPADGGVKLAQRTDAGTPPATDAGAAKVASATPTEPAVKPEPAVKSEPATKPDPTPTKPAPSTTKKPPPSVEDKPTPPSKPELSPADEARKKFASAIKKAERYTRREQHAKAIRAYQAALKIRPDSATAYRGLGNAYYEMGNNDAALQNLLKAKRLNPNEPKVYVLLGAVYQSLGRKKDAIDAFEFYLKMAPNGRFARELRNIITGLKAR